MAEQKYVARLKEKYTSEIVPALVKKYGYTSVMQVPHMEKSSLTLVLVMLLQILSCLMMQLMI